MSVTEFTSDTGLFQDEAPEITVLGVGNIVLKDEGFGVRVLEYLQEHYAFPPQVQLLDGGTLGMELLHFIPGTKRLLILDAIKGETGESYVFRGDEVTGHFNEKLSAHEIGIQDLLALMQVTGRTIDEVVVLGASPYVLEAGTELSPQMEALVRPTAEKALAELRRWGVEIRQTGV